MYVYMFVYYFRLLDRVVLIHVPNRKTMTDRASQSTLWNQRFSKILSHVSSTVGDIVRIGQWLHSTDRGDFLTDCLAITKEAYIYIYIYGNKRYVYNVYILIIIFGIYTRCQ